MAALSTAVQGLSTCLASKLRRNDVDSSTDTVSMLPGEALLFVTALLRSILLRRFPVESTDTLFVSILSAFLSTSAWLVEEELLA